MKKPGNKGFTLIELMIVLAIIVILTALSMIPINHYKNKSKAKELIGFARNCLVEIVSQCEVDPSFNDTGLLDACNINGSGTRYLESIGVTVDSFSGCGNDIQVTSRGNIQGRSTTCTVECRFNHLTKDISCTAPGCSS